MKNRRETAIIMVRETLMPKGRGVESYLPHLDQVQEKEVDGHPFYFELHTGLVYLCYPLFPKQDPMRCNQS
jgi:hypothetical protein